MESTVTDQEINGLLEPVLRDVVGRDAFDHSEVESGHDHDGDPVLFVQVFYRPKSEPRSLTDIVLAAVNVLHQAGESRFPHIRPVYPDDEVGVEDHDSQDA
jgi:hypothetical protein